MLTRTCRKLYAIKSPSNLYGLRFAICLGPHDNTKYKYAANIVAPGTGDDISGQLLVRTSRKIKKKNKMRFSLFQLYIQNVNHTNFLITITIISVDLELYQST